MSGIIEDILRIGMLQELKFELSNDFNKIYTLLKRIHGEELTVENVFKSLPSIQFIGSEIHGTAESYQQLNFYKENLLLVNLIVRINSIDLGDLSESKYKSKYITSAGILSEFYSTFIPLVEWDERYDVFNFISKLRQDLCDDARVRLLDLCAEYGTNAFVGVGFKYTSTSKVKRVTKTRTYNRPDPSFEFFISMALGAISRNSTVERLAVWMDEFLVSKYDLQLENPEKYNSNDLVLRAVATTIEKHVADLSEGKFTDEEARWLFQLVSNVVARIFGAVKNAVDSGVYFSHPFYSNEVLPTLVRVLLRLSKLTKIGKFEMRRIAAFKDDYTSKYIRNDICDDIAEILSSTSTSDIEYIESVIDRQQTTKVQYSIRDKLRKLAMAEDLDVPDVLARLDKCIDTWITNGGHLRNPDGFFGNQVLTALNTAHFLIRTRKQS